MDADLEGRARAWRDDDPDPVTVAEIDDLLDAGDEAALADRFARSLDFGTAGLRGPLGAGPNRMNRVVVRRAAAGLARYLDDHQVPGPVVVGRDARHGSEHFAADTAAVVAATGRDVLVFPEPIPTPLLAYAVDHLDGAAGVMVTASHNPPQDNGYKVYARGGAGIVPPTDAEIAERMAAVGSIADLPMAPGDDARIASVPGDVVDRYLDEVAALRVVPDARPVRVAYTPLHGVGRDLVLAAFDRAGLQAPVVVQSQGDPDPDFSTVSFPNPEEPGATDELLALADREGVDIAIANDPDADRLAVAVPDATGWRQLTGDEVGVLLADHLLRRTTGSSRLVATTVVSSSMLKRMAEAHGVDYAETLTGFKWLAAAAADAVAARPEVEFVLGYEEALGYSIGGVVHDKDGISAAVIFTELVGALASDRHSVLDRLDDLETAHGVHVTRQWSTQYEGPDGPERMAALVDGLRADPPSSLGDVPVRELEDLAAGERLPPTDAVILRGEGMRVLVRPSGTEPKLKTYTEVVLDPGPDIHAARGAGHRRVDAVIADLRRRLEE